MPRRLLTVSLVLAALSGCARGPHHEAPPPLLSPFEGVPVPPPRPPLPAEVVVQERTAYYDVEGATDQEITRSIRAASPIRATASSGQQLDAFTAWGIRWQYRSARDGETCRFTSVTVTVDLTTTLWRWTPPPGAPPALVSGWRERAERLREHEDGHVHYALLGAAGIADALRPLRAPRCDALHDRADAIGQHILGHLREANARYDERTRHGTRALDG